VITVLVNVDIAEVHDCTWEFANLLLKNGWVLLHSYTVINGVENGIVGASARYSLARPANVPYTLDIAEKEYDEAIYSSVLPME
jgi:hypothetical protein